MCACAGRPLHIPPGDPCTVRGGLMWLVSVLIITISPLPPHASAAACATRGPRYHQQQHHHHQHARVNTPSSHFASSRLSPLPLMSYLLFSLSRHVEKTSVLHWDCCGVKLRMQTLARRWHICLGVTAARPSRCRLHRVCFGVFFFWLLKGRSKTPGCRTSLLMHRVTLLTLLLVVKNTHRLIVPGVLLTSHPGDTLWIAPFWHF